MHISANTSPVRENAGWNEAWQQSCSTQMGCVKTFPKTWLLQTKQSVELEVFGRRGGKSPTITSFWSCVCYCWLTKQTKWLLVDRRHCHQQTDISKCRGMTHWRGNKSPWQLTHKLCCGLWWTLLCEPTAESQGSGGGEGVVGGKENKLNPANSREGSKTAAQIIYHTHLAK